jgi:hypothetical protein
VSLSVAQVAQARISAEANMGTVVAVETYSGESAYGPLYGASASVTCAVDATRRLVRGADGVEVVSEFTLLVASCDEAKFTPESRVTIATRTSTVLSVSPRAFRGGTVYVEVACS